MADRTIHIRAIQHYMYCPRRFALLEVNDDWAENAYVIQANLIHKAVHSGEHHFSTKNKIVKSGFSVYNDEPDYDIFGKVDCAEFIQSANGVVIPSLDGLYRVRIIEYKPTPPARDAFHESDAIQVFAQKLCADYLWNSDCEAYIYYSKIRRRIKLPFNNPEIYQKYDNMIKTSLSEMRKILLENALPPKRKGQKCSGCSLQDYCLSKTKVFHVRKIINSIIE
ncbi:MAG: CRISPR-associated protein Cas4 [Eubacteriales bacterium]|nr:CRISPR-associated protein Cas4 [Eubacteriales bacterium]